MRILIVDDEPYTREGLRDLIANSPLPFDDVQTAPSGEAALAEARTSPIDVLLCDVRMPGISGLDLARAIRAGQPECRVVVMSGYNDREYLKTALNLQAVAFIDKPIDEEELFSALRQAAQESLATRRDAAAVRAVHGEKLARAILHGEAIGEEELAAFAGSGGRTVCRGALVHPARLQRMDLLAALERLGLRGVSATDDDGNDMLFIWHRPGDTLGELCAALTADDPGTRVALGNVVRSCEELPSSYKRAKRALSTLFYRPSLRVAYPAGDALASLLMLPPASDFEAALRLDPQEALAHLEGLHNLLLDAPHTPPDLVRTHYHTLLGITLRDRQPLVQALLAEWGSESLWEACMGASSLDELEGLAWRAIAAVQSLTEQEPSSPSYAVGAARRYIHRHFQHESLQLKDIADHVHMSVGHLSSLFKQATGFTLRQYITRCRMEQACELLKKTNARNPEIARQVGYGDPYYFGQVFRREKGMSPQQYRKSG